MRKMTKRGIVSSSSNIKRPKNVKRRKGLAVAGDFVLERERERLHSKFSANPTVKIRWDKKQSCSMRRGLRVGSSFKEF